MTDGWQERVGGGNDGWVAGMTEEWRPWWKEGDKLPGSGRDYGGGSR